MVKKVLLLDDEVEIQSLVADYLRNRGIIVDAFANGVQARKSLEKNKYDLIITDLRMPQEDGINVIYKLKNSDKVNKKTPIVVITGAVDQYDNSEVILNGLNVFGISVLHKPFTVEQLFAVVCREFGISVEDADSLLNADF